MPTVILAGSNKFQLAKIEVGNFFQSQGFSIFNVCEKYKQLRSDVVVEQAIKEIPDKKIIYVVTNDVKKLEIGIDVPTRSYIGTRSIMLIQFGFENRIPVFLSSMIEDMGDIHEKITGIVLPSGIV